jgi:WD40 repeat protein
MKRLRVYLSSTYEDLSAYRSAVSAALRKSGLDVAQMEDYTAADERPLDLCLRDVGQSEIYVGLYAWRYGYVPPIEQGNPERRSITELEYRHAERCGLRKLLFFAHQDTRDSWPDRFRDDVTGQADRGAQLRRFRDEVCTAKTASFFRTPEELATLVLAAIMRSGSGGRLYTIPRLPTGYVARPQLADSIVEALVGAPGGTAGANTLIQGPGGFGKTTLAIEACHQPALVEAFPDGMLWTSLGQTPNRVAILSDLYSVAADGPLTVAGEEQIGLALASVLKGHRSLIVVDDVWRPDDLTPFLRLDGPRLLVTSRVRALAEQAGQPDWSEVVIGEMTADEAAAMLGRGMTLAPSDAVPLQQLAERLGRWPLLLDLVGARILEEVKRRHRSVAESVGVVGALLERKGAFSFDRPGTKERSAALALSVEAGLDAAEGASPGLAARAVELSVFPQNLAVPAAVLADLWGMELADAEEDVLRPLDNLSLLQWTPESGAFRLHPMVSEALGRLAPDPIATATVHRRLLDAWGDPHRLPHDYAWRWFGWHCSRARESTRLRTLLLDLAWLEAKLAATTVDALAREFDYCDSDPVLTQLQATIRLSAHSIATDPLQLPAQLLARIPETGGELRAGMLEQARTIEHDWLHPLRPTLTAPGGPLLRTLVGHTDPITAIALTPDGRHLVSASEDHTARMWDLESGAAVRTLEGVRRGVTAITVSPDGARALGGFRDGRLVLWRLEDGAAVRTVSEPRLAEGDIRAVAITPDGRSAVSASRQAVKVWDLEGGVLERTLDADSSGVTAIAMTADGTRAVCGGGRTLRIWDIQSGALQKTIQAGYPEETTWWGTRNHEVTALALTPDSARVVVASWRRLVLAQLEPLQPLREFAAHTSEVTAVAVTPDGTRIVSGSDDRTLKVWDLASGELVQTLEGHADAITAIAITPDGARAVSACRDQTIKVWNLGAAAAAPGQVGHAAAVTAVTVVPGGMRAITAGDDYTVRIWDLERGELVKSIDTGPTLEEDVLAPGPVWAMASTPDGTRVVSISRHLTVRVWRLEDGALLTTSRSDVRDAIVILDDRRVVFAGEDGLQVLDYSTGEQIATLDGHVGAVTAIAAMPGSSQVVSAGEDGTLRLWDLDRVAELRVFEGHEGIVTSVAATSDGAHLVSGGADATVKVWNVEDGGVAFTLTGHHYRVTHVAVTPDGSRAVSASWDDVPRAWNIRRGSSLGTFAGHDGRVSSLVVTGDGSCAVLATNDGRVAAWSLDGCRCLASFNADAPIVGLAVGSDTRSVIAGDDTGGVHFLRIERAADRPR